MRTWLQALLTAKADDPNPPGMDRRGRSDYQEPPFAETPLTNAEPPARRPG